MKKAISLVMVLIMLVSVTVGCGSKASDSNGESTAGTESSESGSDGTEAADTELEGDGKYKIGVILYSKEDTLGAKMYALLNDAAEALGCEITYALGDYDTTAQVTSAENLVAAGVDGIICLPLAETTSQKLSQLCEDNEIYFGLLLRTMSDETINAEVRANPYFVGNILGDDVGNAKELTRIMIQEYGMTNLCMYYAPEGTSMALRNQGMREALEEYGGTQLSEANIPSDGNTATVASTLQNFINTNTNFQGLVSAAGSGGIGEAIGSTLATMAPEGAQYACFDTYDGMQDAFDNGYLAVVCGGQAPACVYLFSMLYNAMDGAPLTETGEELLMTYMFIRNAEESANYYEYIDNPDTPLYSADEIRAMTVRYNSEFTWEDLQGIMADYTYENMVGKIAE